MKFNLQKTLLVLFALGSWGKTHSPPNDPDAPAPVGNQGEMIIDIDGKETRYFIDSAKLKQQSSPYLAILGEPVGNTQQFALNLAPPHSGAPESLSALDNAVLPIASEPESWVHDVFDKRIAITGGAVRLTHVTGSGPWELDAEVQLETTTGKINGTLRAKIRA